MKLYTYKNETLSLESLSNKYNINVSTLIARLKIYSIEEAIELPVRKSSPIKEGDKFGRLTTIKIIDFRHKNQVWQCKCDCGNICEVNKAHLGKDTKSCGCLAREIQSKLKTKHGKTKTKEFQVLNWMKSRCYNPNNKRYSDYGGRGIKICDRWMDKEKGFENFLEDMGKRPTDKHSIDRINVNGDYTPENCRWATIDIQVSNKRNNILITYKEKTATVAEWSRITGIHRVILESRFHKGWEHSKIIETPTIKYRRSRNKT